MPGNSLSWNLSRTLLAVFPHPDDETSVGPLLALHARRGDQVYLLSLTLGQKGSKYTDIPAGERLGAARERELRCAAARLGIREPILGGFEDQGISAPDAADAVAACLREVIARVRPQVVVTFGPEGLTGHPDHRAACSITTQVFQQQGLLACAPRKLYYVAFPESIGQALPPPYDTRLRTVSDAFVTTEVDCREGLDAATAAINCHETQWSPERMRQFDEINRALFRGRVFLRLALGGPPRGNGHRETGVFEGIEVHA